MEKTKRRTTSSGLVFFEPTRLMSQLRLSDVSLSMAGSLSDMACWFVAEVEMMEDEEPPMEVGPSR
jgi:hypothetical protein